MPHRETETRAGLARMFTLMEERGRGKERAERGQVSACLSWLDLAPASGCSFSLQIFCSGVKQIVFGRAGVEVINLRQRIVLLLGGTSCHKESCSCVEAVAVTVVPGFPKPQMEIS